MVDTAGLFRPLHDELVRLLEGLSPQDWLRPTVAGQWRVRDIVAHLIDTDLRRISAQRDGHHGPPPASPIESYAQLVTFLNELNREWIRAAERLSTQVLLELVAQSGRTCAEVLESVDPMSRAVYPVAWADEAESLGWMDVGRDYTEKWHHQQQIRDAVGAPLLLEEKWARPLFELSVKALPRAYAGVSAPVDTSVQLVIEGPGGGSWLLTYDGSEWKLREGVPEAANTTVRLSADQAWRLFYPLWYESATETTADNTALLLRPADAEQPPPCHFQPIAHRGACGKTGVVPHHSGPKIPRPSWMLETWEWRNA